MAHRIKKKDTTDPKSKDVPDSPKEEPEDLGDPFEDLNAFPGQLLHAHVIVAKTIEYMLEHPEELDKLDPALAKALGDRRLGDVIKVKWTFKALADMPTPGIFAHLGEAGVPHDEKSFLRLAARHTSAVDLADELEPKGGYKDPWDGDLVWHAAFELWRRLLPDRPCVEQIEERLSDGYDALDEEDHDGTLAHWEAAWDLLKRAVPPYVRSLEVAEVVLTRHEAFFLPCWADDLEWELSEGMGYDEAIIPRRLALFTDFLDRFPASEPERLYSLRVAVAECLELMGERERAKEAFEALVRDFPDEPGVWVAWGDACYWRVIGGGGDRDRAEGFYKHALDMFGADKGDIQERLDCISDEREAKR